MEKPSHEFLKILSKSLERENYKLVKSRNTFVQKFDYGTYNVVVSFAGQPLLWLDYGIYVTFDKLEKYLKNKTQIYSNGHTISYWNLIFKAERLKNVELNKHLHDENYKYTDKSLNKAYAIFCEYINPLIDEFKDRVFDYKSLYLYLKTDTHHNSFYSKNDFETTSQRINKIIVQRLILTYNFDKDIFYQLMNGYYKLYDEYKCDYHTSITEKQKEQWREEALKTLEFLDKNMLILD